MDEAKDGSEFGSEGDRPQPGGRDEREARLAKALRDNLRRRKAPARTAPEPPPDGSGQA